MIERRSSQTGAEEPWWKSKTGVLVAVVVVCALTMIIVASCNVAAIGKMSSHENEALKELKDSIKDVQGLCSGTTPTPSIRTTPSGDSGTTSHDIPGTTGAHPRTSPGGTTGAHPRTSPGTTSSGSSSATSVAPPVTPPTPTCPSTPDSDKFDCHPEEDATAERCSSRGCCWDDVPQVAPNYTNPAPVNVPRCFFAVDNMGYRTDSITPSGDGMEILLSRSYPSGLPRDSRRVRVRVIHYDYTTARIVIEDADNARFIPSLPPIADQSTQEPVGYTIKMEDSNSTLAVYRKGTHDSDKPLFKARLANLIFSDQYLQLSTMLPSEKLYGLGDQKGPLAHSTHWTRRILFNKDQPPRANRALYAAHGFMLNLHSEGRASGVFVKNSNAMDVVLQPTPAATFRTLGGILDFFVFTGPSPTEVFRQYQKLIGLPKMVPYWSFGYHLCRYEYPTLKETIEAFERNIKAGVPLEVQWNDIDYMDNYNMFTYDHETFKELPEFIETLHKQNRKYVMIFDPAVSGSEPNGQYPPYDEGMAMDIFLKNVTGQVVPYKVWNTKTSIFPDFSHPRILEYWTKMFNNFYGDIKFDGAWIDMNEPSNQLNGTKREDGCTQNNLNFPPVVIGGEPLFTYTTCMSDKMYEGSMYDLHNHYAHLEARTTYNALTTITKKRPLIISRSSSPGQGFWSGHWTGDIDSTWEDMRQSVTDIINFAMFGMPMLGADICGFQYNTTIELCARWQALGAFYPFSRNHNDKVNIPQDPAAMGEVVTKATINTLMKKYLLLPYLYTLFYNAHIQGDTVFRAMMFNFPEDPATHDIQSQFMWGDGLLVVPALEINATDVSAYLPAGQWYHFNTEGKMYNVTKGMNQTFPAPIDDINLLFRGGHILPAQQFNETLHDSRKNNFTLFVALDGQGAASGQMYWDDGDSLETVQTGMYNLIDFDVSYGTLMTRPVITGYTDEPVHLGVIQVFGVASKPTTLTVNGQQVDPTKMTYLDETMMLTISGIEIDLLKGNNVVQYA